MRVLIASVLSLGVLLVGCQTAQVRDPASPYFAPPVGSRLVLEKAIKVPGGKAAVYIQSGRVLRYTELDRYDPHCKFELRTVSPDRRMVAPDSFLVRDVERFSQSVKWQRDEPVRVAARGGLLVGRDSEGGPFAEIMTTRLVLHSERQPEVFRMECSHWDEFEFPDHLSVNQMRATLKGLFTLELAGG